MGTTTAGQILDGLANGTWSGHRHFITPLTFQRNCQICLKRKPLSNPQEMDMNTTNTFRLTMATGPENTAVLCSSSQGSPLGRTLPGCHSPTKNVWK